MRTLSTLETSFVSGAGKCCCKYNDKKANKGKKAKGNNGFGNGGNDPAPGNSGSTGQDKADDIVR